MWIGEPSAAGLRSLTSDPLVSVVIGRASTEDGERVLETLAALAAQDPAVPCEVLVADRLLDDVTATIRRRYPDTVVIECAPPTALPAMHAIALDRAKGTYVAITEDHCIPEHRWLGSIRDAFANADDEIVAVGGPIENGLRDTHLDWATFLCEYAAWSPPLPEGRTHALAGINVAYRAEAIRSIGRDLLTDGFWETTVHPMLLRRGGRFVLSDRMTISHQKKFSFGLFARQRFLYSRYHAALRFGRERIVRNALMCVASLALPPLVLLRIARSAHRKGLTGRFIGALPWLSAFAIIWAAGEMVGYAIGPGHALAAIE